MHRMLLELLVRLLRSVASRPAYDQLKGGAFGSGV